ncbi:MAG: phosphoenolpyruvate--protein phosphotransferase [Ignavibacteria bacterium]|nr:phosphoenolpyruvate--protein phosphotransferase [Ignavibacteria bacterium]
MSNNKEIIYTGIAASPGISIGHAYVYTRNQIKVSSDIIAEGDIEKELDEFKKAIEFSVKELNKIYAISKERIGEKKSQIFDAQLEILNDKYFLESVVNRIIKDKRTAGYVFDDEISKLGKILLAAEDEYMKERFSDINDVKNRVIRNMKREKLVSKVEENSIIVAHELTPADTILFSKRKVQGYITDVGGITSHAAIISRALRVPAVVGMKNVSHAVTTGELIIIDGYDGIVIRHPKSETIESYVTKLAEYKEYERKLFEVIDLPSETLDGKKIELTANIEFDEEIDFVTTYAHCGIGLYRTEHLFIEKGDFPSEKEQIEEYTHIANVTHPNCVTIRTYDIGGDKLLPTSHKEANPFLGWRGIRICLDRVEIFKEQLRAILIASAKKNVKIMFPMISSIPEIREARKILKEVKKELSDAKIAYDKNIPVGMMIEVPSAVFLAEEFAKEVDFFSIGTNDLVQYILAVDRGNELISGLFKEFHPAVLRAISKIVAAAHKNEITVSVCGEMASNPLASAVLIGLGVDELSVTPNVFPKIKQIIRTINLKELKAFSKELLTLTTEQEIKLKLNLFYKERIGI